METKNVKMVDFTNLAIEAVDETIQYEDVSKQIANVIYSQSKDVGEAEFARDMWKNGCIEVSQEMADVVIKYSENFSYPFREALRKAVQSKK